MQILVLLWQPEHFLYLIPSLPVDSERKKERKKKELTKERKEEKKN